MWVGASTPRQRRMSVAMVFLAAVARRRDRRMTPFASV
jgi:hypothetical protein